MTYAEKYTRLMEMAAAYIAEENVTFSCSADVVTFMRPLLQGTLQEELWVLNTNIKHRILSSTKVFIGTADRSMVHIRDVFRKAILENASGIIVVHNHPSGDPRPSNQDKEITETVKKAGEIIGISLIDHIIIGAKSNARNTDHYSFRESSDLL